MNLSSTRSIKIAPKNPFSLDIQELWDYRDLFFLFIYRDFVSQYKQTMLGPLWFIIQPLLMTSIYTVVFGYVAKISTGDIPSSIFYLSGITLWQYFSDCLIKNSSVFVANQDIYGKVYFPRLISPLSSVVSSIIKFFIQYCLFLCLLVFFWNKGTIHPNYFVLLTPLLVMMLGLIALGFGLIFSALTSKYRDLIFLLSFGIQLWMYATPIIYPSSIIPDQFRPYLFLNPISHIIEAFRYAYLGQGFLSFYGLLYSFFIMVSLLIVGNYFFNKVEKNFMDTV